MTVPFTTQSLQDALTAKLALNFGTEPGEATDQEMLKACALVLRDVMALRGVQTAKETKKEQKKQVHYLSLEFLMGRSLMKNAYNLGVLPELKEALGNLGFKSGDLFELEPDAGLGNGGSTVVEFSLTMWRWPSCQNSRRVPPKWTACASSGLGSSQAEPTPFQSSGSSTC